jgi:type IV secretion system protein TrbJ
VRKQGWIVLAVCLALLIVPVQSARAQFFPYPGATEITQLANHAQLALTYIKEAQTALHAIQMAQMMVREGVNLAKHPSTNIAADLAMLSNILVQSQGLAADMAQMDVTFRKVYGTYNGPDAATQFALKYNDWTNSTLNTIGAALKAAGYQGNLLNNEQLWMRQIQALNQSPQGRNEALQLGNTIAIEEVAQLQKLRQLMIADMTSKGAFTVQQVNGQQAQQAAQRNGFAHAAWSADTKAW